MTNQIDRRRFIFGVLLAVGCANPKTPSTLLDQPKKSKHKSPLHNAYQRAKKLGKPLLVLVAPVAENNFYPEYIAVQREQERRGLALGGLFYSGTPEQIWPFLLSHVVCSSAFEIGRLTGESCEQEFMCVIETDSPRPTVSSFRLELPDTPDDPADPFGAGPFSNKMIQEKIAAGLARLLLPNDKSLHRRASQERAAHAALCDELGSGVIQAEHYTNTPAVLMEEENLPKETLIQTFAEIVKERLYVDGAIEGGVWRAVHPEPSGCQSCGLSVVQPRSEKFLEFYLEA